MLSSESGLFEMEYRSWEGMDLGRHFQYIKEKEIEGKGSRIVFLSWTQ